MQRDSNDANRLGSKLRYLALAWRGRRATLAAMAQRIEQLQNDKRALQAELAALARREAMASHDAGHDALTGLPNRALIKDRFLQAAARADRRGTQVVVLFLDVDRFKQVNDRFGHAMGDRVLQMVAARLQAITRATDTACRYGGDEFVMVLTDVDDAATAAGVAQEIRAQLARTYRVGASEITLQASIGSATYPQDGIVWEALVARADAAMYRDKPVAHRDMIASLPRRDP